MHPGPGRRTQRATHSRPYLRRDSPRHPGELWAPGEPGRAPGSPVIEFGAVDTSLLRGDEGVSSSLVGRLGLVLQGEELVVRKLDLLHLCFSLNFYFLMFLSQFPSMFPLLTYSQSFFSLSANYPRHSRRRRRQILILLIQDKF